MKNISVGELRSQGYKVFVRHCRYYRFAFSMSGTAIPVTNDDPITRAEMNMLAREISGGNQIVLFETLSRGGRTEVEVYNNDVLIGRGIARCSDKDAYNKMIGRTMALGRALKNVAAGQRQAVKSVLGV